RPFYAELVTIPAAVPFNRQRNQIRAAWTNYLRQVDSQHPRLSAASTAVLRRCDAASNRAIPRGLIGTAQMGGLQMVRQFPNLHGRRLINGRQVLGVIRPTVEALFTTINNLGWNDLLFQSSGAFCVRGVKHPVGSATYHTAARRLSEHGIGLALDLNVFENPQGRGETGVMDPRIVALFEAFHFRWGRCFRTPDPHHFEYCGAGC
ncbi:MAG: M15 family metallopeptidase, partial [Candidatus Promineifilaceae bacterium]|nr:M15 family metallopeptidase [Candidatus Promineifilaceae bacterium]